MAPSTPRTYKVISLLLKAVILILSLWYIGDKLNGPEGVHVFENLEHANPFLLFIAFLLMFLNWGLEALKWMLLIAPLEKITFFTALRSVFAGVTVSIFMPNRIGEFAGRIFFLEKADKVEATLRNFIGSAAQLLMTLAIGIWGIFYAVQRSGGYLGILDAVNLRFIQIMLVALGLGIVVLLLLNKARTRFSARIQSYFKALFDITGSDLMIVLLLSFIRYCVFLFQYYLVMKAFGVQDELPALAAVIAIAFLITSAIPSFALTEVVTRGAVLTSLFAFSDPWAVIASSLVIWIINLGMPAMIGSAFIWKLKFFNKE